MRFGKSDHGDTVFSGFTFMFGGWWFIQMNAIPHLYHCSLSAQNLITLAFILQDIYTLGTNLYIHYLHCRNLPGWKVAKQNFFHCTSWTFHLRWFVFCIQWLWGGCCLEDTTAFLLLAKLGPEAHTICISGNGRGNLRWVQCSWFFLGSCAQSGVAKVFLGTHTAASATKWGCRSPCQVLPHDHMLLLCHLTIFTRKWNHKAECGPHCNLSRQIVSCHPP